VRVASLVTIVVSLACCASAQAGAQPLGLTDCAPAQGVYQCSGLVRTWDGVPLDTTVTLPSADAARPLPLIADIHGFGNSKWEYLDPASDAYTGNAYTWAKAGYAVLTYTARGLWGSCGSPDARLAGGADCVQGWIHLADVRYEARDTQELIGRLVDDGTADAKRIGVTGDSYGGGQSLELAALRDRVMLPSGELVPWQSPQGVPLSLAAAAPVIPWSDLMGAIAPNGHRNTTSPVGVFKTSFMNGIAAAAQFATGPGQPVGQPFVPGRPMGFLAPPGVDPDADVLGWVARADRGEPYDDADAQATVERLERYHSPYTIDSSVAPPPLFIGSGFTDDLFPVDEALRFADRTRRQHPRTPVSLMFGDFGHQRAANKPADRKRLLDAIRAWMDHWLRGTGTRPFTGVLATTQTCPRTAPSGGPFTASTFAGLARGAVRFASTTPETIASTGGDPQVAAAIDPVTGGGDACATTKADAAPGTAVYKLPASKGFTLLGAPAVRATIAVSGTAAQIAARLWDVAPDGSSQTLVARGTYRPDGGATAVFQLHANGWRFAPGHVPRLELLGADAPYTRVSNGVFQTDVKSLELTLPTREGTASRSSRTSRRSHTRRGTRKRARQRRHAARRR
jgi:X-Pro dipeptidyl-peptidase (S15 family)/X-Pro dipeptidyl-peptidase C-terminal non-catalytic domain